MKTKQEQIKAMTEDIKRCFEKNSTLDFEQLAERLVQAGYGNVSEYKDNEFAIVAFCNQTVRDICTKKDVEINQAQIDVLNKLKGKYGFYTCCSWGHETKLLGEIIDKFIEEIQNEN